MGYGVSAERHRIVLTEFDGSDNWVEIRAERTSGASARIGSAAFVITGVTEAGTPRVSAAEDFVSQLRTALFRESIVAWTLKAADTDEAPMPLTIHTFEHVLGDAIGTWLDQVITAYYAAQQTDEVAKRRADVGDHGGAAGARRAA